MSRETVTLAQGAKVLLRFPNWLGDVVLCTPALAALRAARPDLRLHALVKAQVRPAVEGLPGIDEVRVLGETSALGTWREARRLRGERFGAALVFPKGFREALLVRLAGIPVRVGLDTDRRAMLLSHPVAFTEQDWWTHHAVQFAKVLSPLGISLGNEGLSFPLQEAHRQEAREALREAGLEGSRLVAFHVTASKSARAWHAQRFAAVAEALRERAGLRAVLLGGPSDRPAHNCFRAFCPSGVDLAGKLSFAGSAALMERAELFVGSDSGPMHVAAAVGTRVVAVFGPGAPRKTAPYLGEERCRVVYAALPCSPCRQAFWEECQPFPSGKPPCLEGVSVEAVLGACLELLERASDETIK